MPRKKKISEIYNLLGIALEDSQHLEFSLAILMLLLNKSVDSPDNEIAVFMENLTKKPLGPLIEKLGKEMKLSKELSEQLSAALRARNFIVHKFFYDQNENLLTINGCKLAYKKLEENRVIVRNGLENLEPIILSLMRERGIDSTKLAVETWLKIEHDE